ncbi:MAG: PTS transporter subunit IIC [Brevinema sp.]
MSSVLNYIVNIFRQPSIFLGVIACVGLMLQKKKLADVVKGSLKSVIGVLVLFQGVDIIINAMNPIASAIGAMFSIPEAGTMGNFADFLNSYGAEVGTVLVLAFIVNILVARFTRFKTIFLTTNLIFWFAMIFVALGVQTQLPMPMTIVLGVVFTSLYLVIPSKLIQPYVKELTNNDTFTIGHTASMFCFLGVLVGTLVKQPEKNTEDLQLPAGLGFLKDTTVTVGLVIFLVYLGVSIYNITVQGTIRSDIFNTTDFFTFSFVQGMMFSAGTVVLLLGARMMLTEIIPAFQGLSNIWAPGAIPALDIPMIFPYGTNSLVLGFIIAIISSIITLFVLGVSGVLTYTVIPLTIACYFDVAPGAIFANKRGGFPAVVITSILGGSLLMIICAVSLTVIAPTIGTFFQAYGGNDFSLWAIVLSPVYTLLGK